MTEKCPDKRDIPSARQQSKSFLERWDGVIIALGGGEGNSQNLAGNSIIKTHGVGNGPGNDLLGYAVSLVLCFPADHVIQPADAAGELLSTKYAVAHELAGSSACGFAGLCGEWFPAL